MKLLCIHIDNFGGLHNFNYNFEDGLNVILHDNGWGKTTMAAFLKAMLYGFDSKRSKDITENERKRYMPWQGGDYGGSLDFEAESVTYRIFRTFGETPRSDKVKILNLDKNVTAKINPDKIGETLFKLDASAFQRSVFINQNGLSINSASSSIHTRLNSLVSQANDVAAYDDAIAALTQQSKFYEKTGARGQIGDITRQITLLEHQRNRLEQDITAQDGARERIAEIDVLLGAINKDLESKKKRLDEVSGEAKKQDASKKFLDELNGQIDDLQRKIDAIRMDLGGNIPSAADIDQVKRQKAAVTSLTAQLKELEKNYTMALEEYQAILDRYNGTLPTVSQLDEIRSVYGKLQGIMFTGNEEAIDAVAEPEGYALIKTAVDDDSEYIGKLKITIGTQTTIQDYIRKLESQDREIQEEKESWTDKKKRYRTLKAEVDAVKTEVEEKAQYNPEEITPVISKLEELQKKQQLVDIKKEELAEFALTAEQEALVQSAPEELPDAAESNSILRKFRNISVIKSDADGLAARLDGEKSKAESLKAAIAQIGSASEADAVPLKEPKKPAGSAMIGGGAAVAVIGAILLFVVSPLMVAVVAAGVVLAVLGVVNNNNYKIKLKEYEAYRVAASRRQEEQTRKDNLQSRLNEVQKTIDSYEKQITELNSEMTADQSEVNDWFAKRGSAETEITEAALSDVLEKAQLIKKLRVKKWETSDKQKFVNENTEAITANFSEAAGKYPEIAGMSLTESLSVLRSAETDYKIKAEKLETAKKSLQKFMDETKFSEKLFSEEKSPNITELNAAREGTAKDMEQAINDANEVFAPIELTVTSDNVSAIFRKAEQLLNNFKQHTDKLKDRDDRQQKKQDQIEELKARLKACAAALQGCYAEQDIPERLTKIREDVTAAGKLKEKVSETDKERSRQRAKWYDADRAVERFTDEHGKFEPKSENILEEIYAKAASFSELSTAMKELEKRKDDVNFAQNGDAKHTDTEETNLRSQVAKLEEKRDNLLVEYTQKSDFIRQTDRSLERYPDVISEIRQLYEQKQKAQNTLVMLKRTIQLITKAKENLADRYLSKVEDAFNNYMNVWLNNDSIRGILDIDFNVMLEENDKTHVAEGYSTGYCDLIDFCMRLALVDTLFEHEQPFLILDDPFVNLDADRLDRALELLNVMAANKQIIYFVCHPIRAVEADENSVSRAEFVQLAKAAKKTLEEHKGFGAECKSVVRKSPKEMYKVMNTGAVLPFKPTKPNYTITNNIFSLNFAINEPGMPKDSSYELFFIDSIGHVLNERQMIEINSGKLSIERVQFCLNTRDDSGDKYELMIRESSQKDYEVIARIPFKAKLAFTGTDSFNF